MTRGQLRAVHALTVLFIAATIWLAGVAVGGAYVRGHWDRPERPEFAPVVVVDPWVAPSPARPMPTVDVSGGQT